MIKLIYRNNHPPLPLNWYLMPNKHVLKLLLLFICTEFGFPVVSLPRRRLWGGMKNKLP